MVRQVIDDHPRTGRGGAGTIDAGAGAGHPRKLLLQSMAGGSMQGRRIHGASSERAG